MKKAILAVLLTAFVVVGCNEAKADRGGSPPWEAYHNENPVAGPTGAQGNQGNQGNPGADGVDGIDGIDGIDGASGAVGTVGATGATGGLEGERSLRYGIASVVALSNIPDDLGSGNTAVGVGLGSFDNANVMALGVVHQFDANWLAKASVSQSVDTTSSNTGHAAFGAGVAYRF